MDDEDLRIRNAITEKEEKFILEETDKEKKRQDTLKAIDDHRRNTIKKHDDEMRMEKKNDLDSLFARKEADTILKENEAKRRQIRFNEARKLANEYLETAVNDIVLSS